MNAIRFAVAFCLVAAVSGCGILGSGPGEAAKIQQALDAIFPPSFHGNVFVSHKNGYFKITIQAGNLRHGDKGWEWDWLRYQRDGFVSTGSIVLGTPPAALFP